MWSTIGGSRNYNLQRLFPFVFFALGFMFFLAGCSESAMSDPNRIFTATYAPVDPTHTMVQPTGAITQTLSLTQTSTVTSTPNPPTVIPTPTWVFQPAGEVNCPILLYHQIAEIDPPSQYYMPPADFKKQMEALRDWGYTAIPMSLLVKAIKDGASLPPHPIIITFDDGWENVFLNAFSAMRAQGFPGVLYITSSYLNTAGYLSSSEVLEMVAAGWEVGDHSMTHLNLTSDHDRVWVEASQSRLDLQDSLGIPINTFAYPYGAADTFVIEKVSQYGYQAAVGVGTSSVQGLSNLFYLSRIQVGYGTTPEQLSKLLPRSNQLP
jgi:peptidoglycan/xylan/chitin deacetylase (PgdA/CDA1 family)